MRENSAVEMGKLTVYTCSKMFWNNLQFYLKIMYRMQNRAGRNSEGFSVPNSEKLYEIWKEKVTEDFNNFGIEIPESEFMQKGSRTGYHTEYFGYILCELQYMQRTYPNCVW